MDLEIREVIAEANRYLPGWGQGIFQTANEIIINEAIRAKIADTQATAKLERQAWDKRAAEMQHELMQEIGAADNTKTAAAPGAAATTTATSASTSTSAATSRKSSVSGPAAPASVDVASTAPTSSQPSTPVTPTTPGAGSGSSKKKGKKKGRK
ncbi:translocation protein S66 [Ascosphaera acerosa]|nr:translocation protein S66 [Ascosphaera acerosa]